MKRFVRLERRALDTVETVLEEGAPVRQADLFDAGDGLTAGVWESGPFTWETDGYPVDETCVVIEGVVVLRHPDGGEERFGPGEAFAIAKGTPLVWHQDGPVVKYFTIRDH